MAEPSGIVVSGVGRRLPEGIEDNETLCRNLDVTPEWIVEKTGIQRRYLAAPDESASDLAISAGRDALAMAGVPADEIDLIIVCTFSGDYIFPPVSARLSYALGATKAQVFDLQANCTGFVMGMTAASDRMRVDPTVRNALVVGVELNSRYTDRSDVNTAIYLSDGAGAAVLSRADPAYGIIGSAFHTDASSFEAVRMRGGGSSHIRTDDRAWDNSIDRMEMNGIATWKQAITHLPGVIRNACAKSGVEPADLDFYLFHQANYNLIEYVVRKMRLDMDRTFTNVREVGNTGAASVAIAMSEATDRRMIKDGDLVLLAAVGAGFTFGASVWRWRDPLGAR